ncbi:MAG: AraC family transcriptional regulator [Citrobacter freundii]|nr:MAG: AraC family transcriptional regulator [Citrobacter freundii]
MSDSFFESNYKKFGFMPIHAGNIDKVNDEKHKPYIKIFYLPGGSILKVDFKQFETTRPSLFFVNSNQYAELVAAGQGTASFIYYNRDFYCVQIHDHEVACDGLLFNNIYSMPMTPISAKEQPVIEQYLQHIEEELELRESSQEEMIRTYLKQLIIRTTRIWKQQNLGDINKAPATEVDFFRDFSRLVEIHFREKHSVADYADLLAMAPKTLSNKFHRLNLNQPNEIIKDRIILEAKRLLTYSAMSVKEIAYNLGYEDPAYFNRLFVSKTGDTPNAFRKNFNGE